MPESASRLAPVDVLVTDVGHIEGPAVLSDGTCVFCQCYDGNLGYWRPDGSTGVWARTGGGPNGSVAGLRDEVYVANNGGTVGPYFTDDFGPGSIQRVSADRRVTTVCREVDGRALKMPNDLVFDRAGRLFFTDPGLWDQARRPDPGFVCVIEPDGSAHTVAEVGNSYPNGIVAEADGGIVWVESYSRSIRRLTAAGSIEEVYTFPDPADVPDGLAVAANGDLYIATLTSGGLHVVARDGSGAHKVDLGGTTLSNCVFAAADLFLTDLGGPAAVTTEPVYLGRLLRAHSAVHGMPMYKGSIAEP